MILGTLGGEPRSTFLGILGWEGEGLGGSMKEEGIVCEEEEVLESEGGTVWEEEEYVEDEAGIV